ncbi:bifunctional pyr operon transcriptional regulator/uracil phosphoribosyltransferase PyrR [Corynebacterium sp. HMSC055D05]|uniref:bifunctional pyr operon transcriptional regulator/uracil phosphoribosyltransferase PyrR n=1 Tax=Corynebacterium sp. HMSC055D05 TaxID=1715213 RepID=UPI0008A11A91|nr:bifunctional pyr operon transcriptional regulator/uracil phosphoribosyltransferase PyrR [Corynebacterium sp. HMSC055D05]OFL92634.1 bifunctional pyr operon transcriptional regulator/uracil phosphoribosyltransferase [Corynebacterium sp. HMSC055D05]
MSGNERSTVELLNAQDVGRTVARIAHQIIEKTTLDDRDGPQVILLGIPSGGVPLAQRIAEAVEEFSGVSVPVGSLDVTLYRDDLRDKPHRALRPTHIPVDIDGAIVVLIDDVLYSGRTIRAALDSLRDIGRPAAIQLAVLVDRGHRELPIRADYVGKNIPTSKDEDVTVAIAQLDGEDRVTLEREA